MQNYSANLWRKYISQLEELHAALQKELSQINSQIEEINVQRKQEQVPKLNWIGSLAQLECETVLANLESKFRYLIKKNNVHFFHNSSCLIPCRTLRLLADSWRLPSGIDTTVVEDGFIEAETLISHATSEYQLSPIQKL